MASNEATADAHEVDRLRAELSEAKHIGRWLYDHSPALRLFLGDVSEWPWLLDPSPPGDPAPARLAEADRDRAVLREFAVLQAAGEDPYDAEDVRAWLGLTDVEFDGSLHRLLHARLVTGGQLFSRSFVETVTHEGMKAAGMLDAADQPLRVLRADLTGFTGTGFGTLRVPPGVRLEPGQRVVVTDEEADALDAKVLTVTGDTATVVYRGSAPPKR